MLGYFSMIQRSHAAFSSSVIREKIALMAGGPILRNRSTASCTFAGLSIEPLPHCLADLLTGAPHLVRGSAECCRLLIELCALLPDLCGMLYQSLGLLQE